LAKTEIIPKQAPVQFMKTKTHRASAGKFYAGCKAGLTKADVVTMLALVTIAAWWMFSMVRQVKTVEKTKMERIKCLTNVKQIVLAMLEYGNENNDRLPEAPAGSDRWAWDMPMVLNDVMVRQGVRREILYDPSFPEQNDDRLWNAAPGKHRVIGYVLALGGPSSSVTASNQNSVITTQFILQDNGTSLKPDPSKRVLVAGAVITPGGQNKTNEMASYNWTSVKSSFPIVHRSAHLDEAKKLPAGENEAMLDGSARWFNWQKMIPRTAGPADVATFWW
jgi:hypothetical protein